MMAKKHISLVCPCCQGEVTHRRYGFNVIRPPRFSTWYVCDACETALKGNDVKARHAAELAFLNFLDEAANATPA